MKTNPVFSSINFLRRNLWIKHHMFTDVFVRFIFIIDLTRYYTNVRGVYQFDKTRPFIYFLFEVILYES